MTYYDNSTLNFEPEQPMKRWYRCSSIPPPAMPRWYGAELGPQHYEDEEIMTLDPIEIAERRKFKHLRVPLTRTAANYREVDSARGESYHDRYMQLSANVAVKHPNPGRPRERMGRIGGSWRHIREVLGYTGSQVCFVDGLVRLYDQEDKSGSGMNRGPAWRARMAGPTGYSANLSGHELQGTLNNNSSSGFALDDTSEVRDTGMKYKGFYTLRQ